MAKRKLSPRTRRKIAPLLRWQANSKHPFTKCHRRLSRKYGSARAARICAANKDRIVGHTRWRKGGRRRKRR